MKPEISIFMLSLLASGLSGPPWLGLPHNPLAVHAPSSSNMPPQARGKKCCVVTAQLRVAPFIFLTVSLTVLTNVFVCKLPKTAFLQRFIVFLACFS
jgi:hypothetical protein